MEVLGADGNHPLLCFGRCDSVVRSFCNLLAKADPQRVVHDFDNDSEDPEIITEYGKSPVSFDACGFNSVRDQVKDILRTKLNGSPDSLAAELTDEIFDALHITPEKQDGPF